MPSHRNEDQPEDFPIAAQDLWAAFFYDKTIAKREGYTNTEKRATEALEWLANLPKDLRVKLVAYPTKTEGATT